MAASYNEITGSKMISGIPSKEYKDNYDLIFGKKDKKEIESDLLNEIENSKKVESKGELKGDVDSE